MVVDPLAVVGEILGPGVQRKNTGKHLFPVRNWKIRILEHCYTRHDNIPGPTVY